MIGGEDNIRGNIMDFASPGFVTVVAIDINQVVFKQSNKSN